MSLTSSIHKLNCGKFQLSYHLPHSHKRRRFKYKRQEDAKAAQKMAEAKFRPDVGRDYAQHTVKELMELHLKKCNYTRILEGRRVVVPVFLKRFGDVAIEDVTKVELEKWLHDLQLERDISMRTVKGWTGNLNYFFDFLVDEEILIASPLRRIKLPSDKSIPKRRTRVIFSEEDLKKILTEARATSPFYFYPSFLTLIHTGARRAEVLKLKWEDVDFNLGALRFPSTKNGEDRFVRIPKKVQEMLKKLPRRSPYVFTCEQGLPIGYSQFDWRLKKFQRMFPIGRKWSLHAFRHSFAHAFLKAGGQMYQLQAILGHRNIDVTIDLYGQLKAVEIENPSPYKF